MLRCTFPYTTLQRLLFVVLPMLSFVYLLVASQSETDHDTRPRSVHSNTVTLRRWRGMNMTVDVLQEEVASLVEEVTRDQSLTTPKRPLSNPKEILLWTPYYIDPYYGLEGYGRQGFIKSNCSCSSCLTTNNRSRLPFADAVIVHMRAENMNPLPQRHHPQQVFVFYLFESPSASFWNERYSIPEADKGSFNLTITYRYDSDIPMPGSGYVVERVPPRVYRPRVPPMNRSRSVVWIVSHCQTPGKRELYMDALAKYIDVDVIGRCGNVSCTKHEPCNAEITTTYKFYVSAENSVCKDYVSEKLNSGLNREMIPLVYGGLDYAKHLPPRSFIDITTFPSPRHLATYLKYLANNETAYLAYFQWRGRFRRAGVTKESVMCSLCQALHSGYHKVYEDIEKWWSHKACNTKFISRMISQKHVDNSTVK